MEEPMTRALVTAAALAACLALGQPAQAQYPRPLPAYGPGYRPGISPYLNLARFNTGVGGVNNLGINGGLNYFLGTIPEQQRRNDAALFRGAINNLDRRLAADLAPAEVSDILGPSIGTGHPTAFNNTGGFFNNANPQVGRRPATPPPTRPPVRGPRLRLRAGKHAR